MKHKLQTLLKHKLQWLMLLVALLGVSQGVWAEKGFFGDGMWAIKFYKNSDSGDTHISGQKNGSTYDIGTVTSLYLKGGWVKTWSNGGWTQSKVRMRCELTSSEYDIYKSAVQGNQTWEQTTWNLNLISSASNNPGTNTVTMTYTLDDYVSANGYFKFTIPGWSTTSGTTTWSSSVCVGSSDTKSSISLGTHYGSTTTATARLTSGNTGDFEINSCSASEISVTFKPTTTGTRTATITITDAYSKTRTLTVTGTGKALPSISSITGETELCQNKSCEYVFSTQNVSSATYSWNLAGVSGLTSCSGATTNAITTTTGAATSSGTISVTATKNGCSKTVTSSTISIAECEACHVDDVGITDGDATLTLSSNEETPNVTSSAFNLVPDPDGSYYYDWYSVSYPDAESGVRPVINSPTSSSTTVTYKREGRYRLDGGAKCDEETIDPEAEDQVWVEVLPPLTIYAAGPLFNGNGYWAPNTQPMTRAANAYTYTYSWIAAYPSTDNKRFTVRTSTSSGAYNYIVPRNFAGRISYTGISDANGGDNHDLIPSITFSAGDVLTLAVVYNQGYNYTSGNVYSMTLTKCTPPTFDWGKNNIVNRTTSTVVFDVKATDLGSCSVSSWGIKAWTNSSCSGDPIQTAVSANTLSTSTASRITVSGLSSNTSYYFKCYAILSNGVEVQTATAYKRQTKINVPSTSDCSSSSITSNSTTLTAPSYSNTGTAVTALTESGFIYSTTAADITKITPEGTFVLTDSPAAINSSYSVNVTGLSPNTTYYYRPFVKCMYDAGTDREVTIYTYGNSGIEKSFTTNSVFGDITIADGASDVCVSGSTISRTASASSGSPTSWSAESSDTGIATVEITNAGVMTITAVAAGSVTITATAHKANFDDKTSDPITINAHALPSSGFTATGVYNGGDATWSTTFADSHRSAVLSTAQSATYYKWYGCNADGSGETASPANVTFSGENTSSCTATFNLPGTYYFKCKAGCSAGDAVSSSVVTVNVPYPSLGIAGPLFNEEWGYVAAGSDGLMTRSDLTWTKRFYCTFSGSDSKQFKVIQQYKGGTTTNSGWDNANRINGASCSVTGITKPDGTAWASGSNFFPASGLSLAAGDQVDLTVTMTGYNTYTVVLEKVCTPPTVYEISSESTAICSGGGGTITLSGSQSGYSYLLYNGIEPLTDKVKSGTGSAIDFSINSSGLYTAKAYYGSDPDACLTNMDGSIVMSISTTPKLVRTAQVVTNYTPVTVTSVSTDIETWTITGTATAYFYDQTANAITFKGSSDNSPYTITARTHGGCESSTTITVTDDTESCN